MAEFEKEDFKFPDEEVKDEKLEIEIEVEDDTPEEDRNKQPMPREIVDSLDKDELSQYDEEVQKKLKQMKKIYHDERREKEQILREQQEAVAYAKRVFEENKRIKQMLQSGEKEYVDSIKSAAEMSLEMAKKAYKEAYESGDTDQVVEAQQQLQEANLRLMQAKNFKPVALQEENFEVQTAPEQYQSVPKPDNRAVSWQKSNTWFGQDKVMTATALGVHDHLKDSGVEVGSDEYYAALDKTMRKRFPENFEEAQEKVVSKAEPTERPKPRTVVAPAVRSTASNKVKLTKSAVNLAKKFGITPEQYAIEMKKLEASNV